MNTRIALATLLGVTLIATGAQASKQVSGTVESVNTADNKINLRSTDEKGEQKNITISWKDDFKDLQKIENAKVGSQLTVEANNSIGAREVASIISDIDIRVPMTAARSRT